jgi:hypothetical protein
MKIDQASGNEFDISLANKFVLEITDRIGVEDFSFTIRKGDRSIDIHIPEEMNTLTADGHRVLLS